MTNTAVCDYNFRDLAEGASRCYGRFEEGKWVKGCAFNDAPLVFKLLVERMIKRKIQNDI
jgi:hypothetical protein